MMDGEVLSSADSQENDERFMAEMAVQASLPLAKPGHVFTSTWLCEQMGIGAKPAQVAAYEEWRARRMRCIGMWREGMGNCHIHTHPRGEGYVVIEPNASAALLYRQTVTDVSRSLRVGLARMETWIDADRIDPRARQQRIDLMSRAALMAHAVKQQRIPPSRLLKTSDDVRALPAGDTEPAS